MTGAFWQFWLCEIEQNVEKRDVTFPAPQPGRFGRADRLSWRSQV